jgi:2-polyprenyl-3-methyl-5-hydroxy-6-metoxy-1,4-benzoquinol methylase
VGGFLSPEAERERYAQHNNDPEDPQYRSFLDRLVRPLVQRLTPGAEGLDFGCGPGPTLSRMLTEQGYPTAEYDPYFFPDASLLARRWDFVTATEVLEHLQRPGEVLGGIASMLQPGGFLGAMTRVLTPETDFSTWWYVRDETHVCFWRPSTFSWIAERYGWTLEEPHSDVRIFRAPL